MLSLLVIFQGQDETFFGKIGGKILKSVQNQWKNLLKADTSEKQNLIVINKIRLNRFETGL